MQCPSAPGESADTFHGRHCHGLHALPITKLGEHIGLEVGNEDLEVGCHQLGRCPRGPKSTYMQHMQRKLCQSHFKKTNVQICNAKDPNIKLQAIQRC
jgi:hypothetical protein